MGTKKACEQSWRAQWTWAGLPAGLWVTPSLAFTGSVSLGNVLPTADIAQFKQGVKSVAGKMAVLANGVMNSLQVRLGLLDLGWEGPRVVLGGWPSPHPDTAAGQPPSLRQHFLFLEGQLPSFELSTRAGPLPV